MKIIFWTDGFWPRKGGIETQGDQFIREMQQRGHEYRVFATRDSPRDREEEIYNGIPIRRFDFRLIEKNVHCLRLIREEVQRVIDEFQPDIVHLNANTGLAVFAFFLIHRVFRMPIISTLHSPFFYKGKNPVLERIATISNEVYCVSKWTLNQVKAQIPFAAHKVKLIYNGLHLPNLDPAPLCFSLPTLLLLGRLAPEKGFDTAIRAFSLLKKSGSDAKLIIAGGGQERLSLEHLVDQLELKDAVHFTGELSREEGLQWINRATLVIVPSYFEPFGLVALEAMHLKRPVIASRVGGLREIILGGKTGILVPPQAPSALYQAIQELLNDPNRAIQMGLNGYKRATQKFTLEQNIKAYEKSCGLL